MSDDGEQRYWTPRPHRPHWSEERDAKFKELFAMGLSHSKIAAELGDDLTRNACIGRANRLGLHRFKSEPKPKRIRIPRDTLKQKEATAAILANPEISNCALAAQLGVSETTIRMARHQLKFPPPPRPPLEPGRKYQRRVEPRVADAPEWIDGAVRLFDLQFSSCRWPVGEATGYAQLFCGCQKLDPHPYCAGHACRAYPYLSLRTVA
jgi:GcrA cell cycle regulator